MLTRSSSDPSSPKYGQYWSAENVHDMFAPPEETVSAVMDWLTSSGIHRDRLVHTDNKGWIAFDASVQEVEGLLLTEFYEHEHKHSEKIRVGCDKLVFCFTYHALLIIQGIMFQSISHHTSITSHPESNSHL
jgi:subtilase family serine protease